MNDTEKKRIADVAAMLKQHAEEETAEAKERKEQKAVLPVCQSCGSDRIYCACGHGKDLNWFKFKGREHDGCLPDVQNLGGGDDLEISVCLDCGQAQGKWPAEDPEFEEDDVPW